MISMTLPGEESNASYEVKIQENKASIASISPTLIQAMQQMELITRRGNFIPVYLEP
jgi:hypothetical protein